MIKIKYPVLLNEITEFNKLYIEYLNFKTIEVRKIDSLLSRVEWRNSELNFEVLLTSPIEHLSQINKLIFHHLTVFQLEELYEYFDYEKSQSKIARFFMSQRWVKFDSCYYCNIDSIFSFSDALEYLNPLDFINHASEKELQLIEGLGAEKSIEIIRKRNNFPFSNTDDIPVGPIVRDRIQRLELKKSHNHFTIDHFHHKDQFNFLSLSLYNFVPSCYACNSKFKKTKSVGPLKSTYLVSPSSKKFSQNTAFSFKLYMTKALHEIKKIDDFVLRYKVPGGQSAYTDFLDTFKIMGRYHYYKSDAFDLIQKKVEYPESRIKEIANTLGKSHDEMRADLFGKEYFDSAYDQKSLIKFKRDIAKQIKLLGVID
ncbi:hypothetical protein [Sphingobacterium sp.]|uniref:hypothetical protein n=1 Tax=Sphingobacterium sp. TaxID=341027 RepID=UPI0028986CA1|nr:hypothetical protein [Sphingobacterium sp.]